ncbi:MAG: Clp protease N-terminal domain-containing protein, partial [Chloroflexota bacterium]
MDLKRYTNKAQEALVGAQTLTTEFGHSQLEPLHLLTALMQQDEGVVPEVVAKIGGRPAILQQELEQMIQDRPHVSGSNVDPTLSRDTVQTLNKAENEAKKMHDDYVSTEHILLALTEEKSVRNLLERHGVTHDSILKALTDIRGGQRVTSQDPESTYKSLEKYGRDLTAAARQG